MHTHTHFITHFYRAPGLQMHPSKTEEISGCALSGFPARIPGMSLVFCMMT